MRIFLLKELKGGSGGIPINLFCSLGVYKGMTSGFIGCLYKGSLIPWHSRDEQHVELKVKRVYE